MSIKHISKYYFISWIALVLCYYEYCDAQCGKEIVLTSSRPLLFNAVDFVDSNRGIIVGNQVARTSNGGENWEVIEFADTSIKSFSTVFMHSPLQSTAITSTWKVYQTADRGNTWLYKGTPPTGRNRISFWDNKYGLCVGSNKIYRTTNGGTTWNVVYSTSPAGIITSVICIDSIHAMAIGGTSLILRTTDKGTTWLDLSYPTGIFMNDIIFSDSQNGFINTQYDILHTTNGGVTWNYIYLPNTLRADMVTFLDSKRWLGTHYNHQIISTANA